MAKLKVKEQVFDVSGIVFDKDGTLIDFNHIWGTFIEEWIENLLQAAGQIHVFPEKLRTELDRTMGFNRNERTVVPDSPLAVTTLDKMNVVAMTVLFQNGYSWHESEACIQMLGAYEFELLPEHLRTIGDPFSKFNQLVKHGIEVVICTNDERDVTEKTLAILGLTQFVSLVVTGDDPHPSKPNRAGFDLISDQLNIPHAQFLMVGDTVSDLKFGRNSGVAGTIAINSGGGHLPDLQANADVIIDTIDEIEIISS